MLVPCPDWGGHGHELLLRKGTLVLGLQMVENKDSHPRIHPPPRGDMRIGEAFWES